METLFAQSKEINMARISQHRKNKNTKKQRKNCLRAQQQNQEIWFTWLQYQ